MRKYIYIYLVSARCVCVNQANYYVRDVCRNAQVEVKNKKGNSPMWLAANGGHLQVVELLHKNGADIDSQDNRKVSVRRHESGVARVCVARLRELTRWSLLRVFRCPA